MITSLALIEQLGNMPQGMYGGRLRVFLAVSFQRHGFPEFSTSSCKTALSKACRVYSCSSSNSRNQIQKSERTTFFLTSVGHAALQENRTTGRPGFDLKSLAESQKTGEPLGPPSKTEKRLSTNEVTSSFYVLLCAPEDYTSFSRSTEVSGFKMNNNHNLLE